MPAPGDLANLHARGEIVAYFGYGSLVNRATHRTAILHAVPARLTGWRRTWRPRPDMPGFPAALLSIRPEPRAACDGLIVFDRAENLAAVDAREARYQRLTLDIGSVETDLPLPGGLPLHVYVAQTDVPPHPEPPKILRSYLDAVLQGFLAEHGEAGVRRFLEDTEGFGTPIHDDRDRPVYPRAVELSGREQALFETLLAKPRQPDAAS
ncbi:gamma-glutamylcyclotransferase [Aquibium carbonis]|uniref:Gamma-glutamylcyclotransferase n=1 Tax=Aquibium carbonis TaxID=2495581 RepID=A0A429YK36_9HYPH|nr:gamma-glutamylcyclotransferase family protein [Aquibium carbonis]RST81792.1 gamma-glutamylcyclotransferase [Aquibium carbonis]